MRKILLIIPACLFFLSLASAGALASPPDPATDPDVNLSVRGWVPVANPPLGNGLIDVTGPTDNKAPSLTTLIRDNPDPSFSGFYQVNDWDWGANQKSGPILMDSATNWGVTMAGFSTTPGQTVQVPDSGYDMGGGYEVVVLYATPDSLTIHYTPADSVADGYVIHLADFAVNPDLLADYAKANSEGRAELPALSAYGELGKTTGSEILVAIRDTGTFMDPRAKKDWWQTRPGGQNPLPTKLQDIEKLKQKTVTAARPYAHYADETETPCSSAYFGTPNHEENLEYRKSNGQVQPEMRGDAGFNWVHNQVRGTHCGQVKSQPIVVEEVAPFEPDEGPICKVVTWMGEIGMNYGSMDNFRIPFAEQIADAWGGTWDAEHLTESDIEKKTKEAAEPPAAAGILSRITGMEAGSFLIAQGFPPPASDYGSASVEGAPYTGDPTTNHELNLGLLGEKTVNEGKGLVACGFPEGEPPDPEAPQLSAIVDTDPTQAGAITGTYQLENTAKNWPVEVIGLAATPGQSVNTPGGGHDIGGGYKYMVLYADENSVTLTNTRQDYSDAPVEELGGPGMAGYTIYYQGVNVNPDLLALYENLNSSGRANLPVLEGDRTFGTAAGDEVKVVVRDSMDFMDPRSKYDWWNEFESAPAGACKGGVGGKGTKAKKAPYELMERSGTLKKLLSEDSQDALKCSFINYAKRIGGKSLYNGFKIEGTPMTAIPCPPTIANPKATSEEYWNWQKSWGSKWAKMGLVPNDRSTGEIKFVVCGDREYPQSISYPEVMKMGLAGNELFKIFTAKDERDKYYRVNGDTANLAVPLDKNRVLSYGESAGSSNLATRPVMELGKAKVKDIAEKGRSGLEKIFYSIMEKFQVLAQDGEPAGPEIVGNTREVDGKIVYWVQITNPPYVEDDIAAELYINGEKAGSSDYHKFLGAGRTVTIGSKGSGAQIEVDGWKPLAATGETYDIMYHVTENYQCVGGGAAQKACQNGGFTGSVEKAGYCRVAFGSDGSPSSTCGGEPPPAISELPVCSTAFCRATCSLCGRAQRMPSDTTIWKKSYPANHVILGVNWINFAAGLSDEATDDPVKLIWEVKPWAGGFDSVPEGCEVKLCDGNPNACKPPARVFVDPDTGRVANISCSKVNDRTIDVYNEVPFLASAWAEAAGGGSDRQIGGFLNVFRPFCDPTDPNSTCAGSQLPGKNFTGCTGDEKYVFDPTGYFNGHPGASELTYDFHTWFGSNPRQFTDGVTVTQISPKKDEKAKVLFYRLGGLCNANTWVSQRALSPLTR